jgi:hypothetical protein
MNLSEENFNVEFMKEKTLAQKNYKEGGKKCFKKKK